eukprot:CAMPEP_0172310940 /NCGR_PEP_ID=MMETSP1058-20130122/13286_1 /TAXON_ID=83371 /ORGANISM="Detonula confervacea, Strain CCMP 353" /LENGTH=76 /DNA_ID=CAMNT_0013023953 /DNA_START=192 /DNA_END=418 /DNA_ORIENTATION=-
MINRLALIVVLAAAATVQNADAFVVPSSSYTTSALRPTTLFSSAEPSQLDQINAASQQATDAAQEAEKLIMDMPPS